MATLDENPKLAEKFKFFIPKIDINLQETFKAIFAEKNGNWAAIKGELSGKEGFTEEVIQNLEFTDRLVDWGKNNATLISLFQGDEQIHSMRDIALNLNKTAFVKKVEDAVPTESKEEKQVFALNLRRELFYLEPTALVANMIKDPEIPILNDVVGVNLVAVLAKQPEFNIKTTPAYELIKNEEAWKDIPAESQEPVKIQLKALQRIVALSPEPDAIPVLYNAKLQSAMQISALPKTQFMKWMSNSGLDENTLLQIHSNAQQAQVRNEQFLMAVREVAQPTGIALIDQSLNASAPAEARMMKAADGMESADRLAVLTAHVQEVISKHNLSWDLLFGDADFCECGECNSVYSAASYFVELLNYLRNNNLDPDPDNKNPIKEDPRDISDTPLEKLFNRRPDLGCLELTCQNTNTLIPYVDLVNEVMENYVAFKRLKPFNVEDETSGELLAEPQHTEYQAYCILKNEVYPFTLPYHQPIYAARIYLKYLDTSRHELIDTFRKNNAGEDDVLVRLKDEVLDRAADAEFLEMTKEEYVILTKECFESITLMRKLKDNPALTRQEYWEMIGGRPVHEYYGYADEDTMLGENGLTQIKKEFLRRTGIDYFNLVDLLKTETLNPCIPKGRSKAIMESLRFSYRFLQNYAEAHGIDKMAEDLVKLEKFADLAPLLRERIELLTKKKVLSCPDTGPDDIDFCDKDIICWVKYQFEKIGKMIVIESGRSCVNGKILLNGIFQNNRNFKTIAIVDDCKILFYPTSLEPENNLKPGSIDIRTGKVIAEGIENNSSNDLRNLRFIGDKGEQGIFLKLGDEVYLVFTEQKDSCDLETALLQHLDGTPLTPEEYDRFHRFIRLWHKLGWTIDETDKAIIGLSAVHIQDNENTGYSDEIICDDSALDDCHDANGDCGDWEAEPCAEVFDITPELIHQLVAVRKLLDKTGLELIRLLSFWTAISTAGEKSLYQKLFLTHNVLGIDKVFKADDRGNYLSGEAKLTAHLPVVMAALNLSAEDIQSVMGAVAMEDKLTLDNLSVLYRYRLLSKLLGLRIPAFVSILSLFGDIFANAHATLEFMERWGRMEDAGFSYQQLNYVVGNVDDERKPFAPSQKEILQLSKTLYDGLNAIDEAHKDLAADPTITSSAQQEINIQEQATSALVRAKASLLFESSIVEKIMGMLEGTNVFTTNAPKDLDVTLPETATLNVKLKYDKVLGSVQITGILTESEVNTYKAITPDSQWHDALKRIQKQQDKLFKELLTGIFKDEKTKTNDEKAPLICSS